MNKISLKNYDSNHANCVRYSIIISTFNRSSFLDQLLTSIFNQNSKLKFEVIIVEGGHFESFKNISSICSNFSARIKIYHLPNSSLGQSRNFGVENASGVWCLFADDDDLWSNQKIFLINEHINKYDVISHGYLSSTEPVDDDFQKPFYFGQPIYLAIYSLIKHCYGNRYGGGSSLCVRTDVVKVIKFNESMRSCEDIEWILRCLFCGMRMGFIPAPLVTYRVHAHRMTGNISKNIKWDIFLIKWLLVIGLGTLLGAVIKIFRTTVRFVARR